MAYFVYILYSPSLKKFYKGQTLDLTARYQRHNNGYEKATQSGRPWLLLWAAEKETRAEAIALEMKLKNLSTSRLIQFMLKYSDGCSSPDELHFITQLSGY